MTIYLDVIFFLNFIIDFLILITLSITLKYRTKIIRLILSSLVGSLSLIVLFINLNSFSLFIFKIILSFIMCTISYKFISFKHTIKNIIYFFFISIIYGGFLYFLINQINLNNIGLTFIKRNTDINLFVLLLISPIILFTYIKMIHQRYNINLYRKVIIYINKNKIELNGFIDTGNNLKDPYTNSYVMITSNKVIKEYIENNNYLLIPYKTINENGFLKTKKFKKVIIDGKLYKDICIAYMENVICIDNVDIILNKNMIGEDLC